MQVQCHLPMRYRQYCAVSELSANRLLYQILRTYSGQTIDVQLCTSWCQQMCDRRTVQQKLYAHHQVVMRSESLSLSSSHAEAYKACIAVRMCCSTVDSSCDYLHQC
jgi:hypothetical protein